MPDMLDNHEGDDEKPQKKRRKLSTSQENNSNNQDTSFIKVFNGSIVTLMIFGHFIIAGYVLFICLFQNLLVSFTASICQRLESIESKLQALDATCKALGRKLDSMVPCGKSPIQVPMVAGSPQGATQTWNKVRW